MDFRLLHAMLRMESLKKANTSSNGCSGSSSQEFSQPPNQKVQKSNLQIMYLRM